MRLESGLESVFANSTQRLLIGNIVSYAPILLYKSYLRCRDKWATTIPCFSYGLLEASFEASLKEVKNNLLVQDPFRFPTLITSTKLAELYVSLIFSYAMPSTLVHPVRSVALNSQDVCFLKEMLLLWLQRNIQALLRSKHSAQTTKLGHQWH